MGSLFQTRDAVEETDFDVAIDFFLNGADMVMEEEDRSDREGTISWKNLSEARRLLVVQHLESSCGNFEINSMANR